MISSCLLACFNLQAKTASAIAITPFTTITVNDTVPKPRSLFQRIRDYRDSLRRKPYRDSLIRAVTRQNVPEPAEFDSSLLKSEEFFTRFTGRVIRDIYYRQVPVFGPRNIYDTTFTTSMKLIHLANRLHFKTEEWVIRQSLFFREHDTISPFVLADNERYLRNRPFIQDARIYIINASAHPDSVDLLIVTKDVFEYGIDVSQVSTSAVQAGIYNNNLFGAAQGLKVGGAWHKNYTPQWNTEIRYNKYNIGGTFIDASAGYTTLNNYMPLDTGTYEGSYYVSFNRPLYRSSSKLVGGLSLATSFSINAWNRIDSQFRDYRYSVIDAWVGYNFFNRYGHNGKAADRPSMALLLRHYNLFFQQRPSQKSLISDPLYNNHRLYIAQFVLYKQDFFKTHHFFGFGRTEDIPLGYNLSVASGWETWLGRTRMYTGFDIQRFWQTKREGLVNITFGLGSFWQHNTSEDAVIHANMQYYSRLITIRNARFRQFATVDYLGNPNNLFYRPLDINYERGIWGYRNTKLNGYQRLNLRSETVYYSPLKILGFKFNFFASMQASILTIKNNNIFKNPIYSGFGLGCHIRNENLPLNTLKFALYYYPGAAETVNPIFPEVNTVSDFRFDISPLRAPNFQQFR